MRPFLRAGLSTVAIAALTLTVAPVASVAAAPIAAAVPSGYSGGCGNSCGGCGNTCCEKSKCDRRTAKQWNDYYYSPHQYDFDEFFGYEYNDHDYWDQDRHWYGMGYGDENETFKPEYCQDKACDKPVVVP